jgi:hypothetical protein
MADFKQKAIHRCQCEPCRAHPYSRVAQDHQAINRVVSCLDEKSRRRVVGLLASRQKRGGIECLHQISGLSRTTIRRGRAEVHRADRSPRVRGVGAGRKAVEKNDPPS